MVGVDRPGQPPRDPLEQPSFCRSGHAIVSSHVNGCFDRCHILKLLHSPMRRPSSPGLTAGFAVALWLSAAAAEAERASVSLEFMPDGKCTARVEAERL